MAAVATSQEMVTVGPTTDRLASVVSGLDASYAMSVRAMFEPMFVHLEKWERLAREISVTSEAQTGEMKMAHTLRMEIRKTRVGADKARKNAKANILLQGRAIDGAYNIFEAAVAPIEAYLLEQESFAERAQAARRDELRAARSQALQAYGADPSVYAGLGEMSEETWASTIDTARMAHEARLEAARQAEAIRIEAERIAAERREAERQETIKREAERAERERLQAEENARLKREAAEAEELAMFERQKAAAEKAEAERVARAEREAIEAKAKAEREAAEAETRKAQAEVERLEAERVALVKAERERAEAEVARLEAEKARIEAEEAAEAEAKRAAELAPDREKLMAFAAVLRGLPIPSLTTGPGIAASKKVREQLEKMAVWVERTGRAL